LISVLLTWNLLPSLPDDDLRSFIRYFQTLGLGLGTDAGTAILAGAEGFEPPSPVLETGSLTVELTPLDRLSAFSYRLSANTIVAHADFRLPGYCLLPTAYLVSLCDVCLRQNRQNLLISIRPVVVFLFLVFE
jgi:hypothetical protein